MRVIVHISKILLLVGISLVIVSDAAVAMHHCPQGPQRPEITTIERVEAYRARTSDGSVIWQDRSSGQTILDANLQVLLENGYQRCVHNGRNVTEIDLKNYCFNERTGSWEKVPEVSTEQEKLLVCEEPKSENQSRKRKRNEIEEQQEQKAQLNSQDQEVRFPELTQQNQIEVSSDQVVESISATENANNNIQEYPEELEPQAKRRKITRSTVALAASGVTISIIAMAALVYVLNPESAFAASIDACVHGVSQFVSGMFTSSLPGVEEITSHIGQNFQSVSQEIVSQIVEQNAQVVQQVGTMINSTPDLITQALQEVQQASLIQASGVHGAIEQQTALLVEPIADLAEQNLQLTTTLVDVNQRLALQEEIILSLARHMENLTAYVANLNMPENQAVHGQVLENGYHVAQWGTDALLCIKKWIAHKLTFGFIGQC